MHDYIVEFLIIFDDVMIFEKKVQLIIQLQITALNESHAKTIAYKEMQQKNKINKLLKLLQQHECKLSKEIIIDEFIEYINKNITFDVMMSSKIFKIIINDDYLYDIMYIDPLNNANNKYLIDEEKRKTMINFINIFHSSFLDNLLLKKIIENVSCNLYLSTFYCSLNDKNIKKFQCCFIDELTNMCCSCSKCLTTKKNLLHVKMFDNISSKK